jgi:hypothetical protein
MQVSKKKKVAAALGAGAIAVSGAGIAFAYWSTSGSTTTTASTGSDEGVDFSAVSAPTGLYPGGPAQALDYTVENNADFDQYVGSVSIVLDSIKDSANANVVAGCTAADFTLVQPDEEPGVIGSGETVVYDESNPSGASIAMNETGFNQDDCKNVTLNFTLTAHPEEPTP